MLGAVTGRAMIAPCAAAWVRRLAVLLSVLAALAAVRGPVCTDGMASDMPAIPAASMSMVVGGPDAAAPVETGSASMPVGWCAALTSVSDGSTAGLGSCMQAPPTVLNVTGVAALAAAGDSGTAIAAPAAAPPMIVDAVRRHAVTLHQIGLLRT